LAIKAKVTAKSSRLNVLTRLCAIRSRAANRFARRPAGEPDYLAEVAMRKHRRFSSQFGRYSLLSSSLLDRAALRDPARRRFTRRATGEQIKLRSRASIRIRAENCSFARAAELG